MQAQRAEAPATTGDLAEALGADVVIDLTDVSEPTSASWTSDLLSWFTDDRDPQ